ncbi:MULTISPECIES: glutamate-5-semialdehyde dehydrogenase [unclassified Arenibacter]|uniref:glutamate-5-semialdehyde dehydrogenase n=1 Tax=unclassified Arenibacter TaxID=2615047 RepID=UPI000E340685|nr:MULTISPECIES: glutamate-5-semialdehyde dehydrogenase [unclassified Arenibacter]MCM4163794.1 glutamate-5-semialdehyde dehydrogenase [Arenibacter sp. A80]RFT56510.1 glutamate-5-semialdehyde dehydrogenase [Arenibacter sp. P308M17]
MSLYLDIAQRNAVLNTMAQLIDGERNAILEVNKKDLEAYKGDDLAMYDRLKVDGAKIDGMVLSLQQLAGQEDPLGLERFSFTHENGMQVSNKTAPFGTILIIYESRPDVTIEAAAIAFKSGNKILLKGGKESLQSNLVLVNFWHKSLEQHGITRDWVTYLEFNREQTQAFLEKPTQKLDLIVPRGGEKLISFTKKHASCPVIVSGRGNNFLYVHPQADLKKAMSIILNAKTTKISACNALDKVLIDSDLPNKEVFIKELIAELKAKKVEILVDNSLANTEGTSEITEEDTWFEEFLDYKILIGKVDGTEEAIEKINTYGGGHSAVIVTEEEQEADLFMNSVDSAAVYHNVSTRFTDGGQFGLGGELAISTDKLHQRGPIGLQHLVTNKWYVKGDGQIR